MARQGLGGLLVGAGLLAGQAQAHQAPAAHQRHGGQLVFQLGRIAVDIAVGQHGGVEGIVRPFDHALGQGIGAVAHDAPVLAVEHHGTDVRGRLPQEAFDVRTL